MHSTAAGSRAPNSWLSCNLATVVGVVFATLFRLFCYRRFVFNLTPPAPAPVEKIAELATVS